MPAFEPFDIQDEIVPILEARIQNGFTILRLIIFMFQSVPDREELDGFGGQFLGIIAELVVKNPAKPCSCEIPQIGPSQEDGLPVARTLYIFSAREGAYAERSIECL